MLIGHVRVGRPGCITVFAFLSCPNFRVSNLRCPAGCMRSRMAINEAQHKIVNLLKTIFFSHQFSLVFVFFMCGPRQLFFQFGPEM